MGYKTNYSHGYSLYNMGQELIRTRDSERELHLRRHRTRTSKYNPLLNIQHAAARVGVDLLSHS